MSFVGVLKDIRPNNICPRLGRENSPSVNAQPMIALASFDIQWTQAPSLRLIKMRLEGITNQITIKINIIIYTWA